MERTRYKLVNQQGVNENDHRASSLVKLKLSVFECLHLSVGIGVRHE